MILKTWEHAQKTTKPKYKKNEINWRRGSRKRILHSSNNNNNNINKQHMIAITFIYTFIYIIEFNYTIYIYSFLFSLPPNYNWNYQFVIFYQLFVKNLIFLPTFKYSMLCARLCVSVSLSHLFSFIHHFCNVFYDALLLLVLELLFYFMLRCSIAIF